MNIIYATYISNQNALRYPVKFLLANIPSLKIFCADEFDRLVLRNDGIFDVENIGYKVTNPGSIAEAQNICVDKLFKRDKPDFVVWVQADIFLTQEAHKTINKFCMEENLNRAMDLQVRDVRLFFLCEPNHFGCTVIGREATNRFIGDGAYVNDVTTFGSGNCCIHIGYIGIAAFRKHMAAQINTWGLKDVIVPEDNREFILTVMERNKVTENNLIAENTIFYELVKKLGMEDEYNEVKELIAQKVEV